jgi:hypothetical protein
MPRRMPKSFFWIDQALIRMGIWEKLSAQARLTYVALSATCDREGLSLWSVRKLQILAATEDAEAFGSSLSELERMQLVERRELGFLLCSFDLQANSPVANAAETNPSPASYKSKSIVIRTLVEIGGADAES